jgi:hypothetical protein
VPKVVGKTSAFEAETAITEAKLRLAPQTKEEVDGKVPPGTVLSQTPGGGETAEEDSEVTILVAVGNGKVNVPNVVGQNRGEAEKTLRDAGLTLGQATPQPVDTEAAIKSQIPAEREVLNEGSPVDIFLEVPKEDGGQGGGDKADAPAGGSPDDSGDGGGGGCDPPVVPAVAGANAEAYAQKVGDELLVPKVKEVVDEADKGTIFRVSPEPGEELERGETVTIFVSAGIPALAYDNDKDVLLVNSETGKALDPIATTPQVDKDPTWSYDGKSVAYQTGGQVFQSDREKPDEPALALTPKADFFRDLAFAPTGNAELLAMVKVDGSRTHLCFGEISADGMTPRCLPEPANDVILARSVVWSPTGKSVLVFGIESDAKFGIVRYTTKTPFSSDPEDWKDRGFVTDVSQPNKGVIDAQISADGKRMAVVHNFSAGQFRLYLTYIRE